MRATAAMPPVSFEKMRILLPNLCPLAGECPPDRHAI
jgi:hypothetical protein